MRAHTLAWAVARLRCVTAHVCSPAALRQATASFAALPAMALDVLQPLLPSQQPSSPLVQSFQPMPAYVQSLPQWPRFQQQTRPDAASFVHQAPSAALPRLAFPQRLTRGVLEGRPSRFIMRVRLDDETVEAHCPTTTRIGGLSAADLLGAEVLSHVIAAALGVPLPPSVLTGRQTCYAQDFLVGLCFGLGRLYTAGTNAEHMHQTNTTDDRHSCH